MTHDEFCGLTDDRPPEFDCICFIISQVRQDEREKAKWGEEIFKETEIVVRSYFGSLITNLRDADFAVASEEAKRITELVLEDVSKIAGWK